MFINLTNHPSADWSEEQLKAAHQYGEVVDLSFPDIKPYYTKEEVLRIVKEYYADERERHCNPRNGRDDIHLQHRQHAQGDWHQLPRFHYHTQHCNDTRRKETL